MKKILTRLLSLGLIGATLAIAVPDIFFFSPISNVDLANHYLMVQSGTTQNRINAGDFATSISGAFTGVYVPRSNIDTGFNNTGSDTIIPSEAAIWSMISGSFLWKFVDAVDDYFYATPTGTGDYSIYMGRGANAVGLGIAIGNNATTAGAMNGIAIGTNATAYGRQNIAIGHNSNVGYGGIAIGDNAKALGTGAISLGRYSNAGYGGIAIGDNAEALGTGAISLGRYNTSDGNYSTAIGKSVKAIGDYAFAIGRYNEGITGALLEVGMGSSIGPVHKNALTITSGGNVGIATTTPQAELDVNGTGLFSGKVAIGTDIPLAYRLTVKADGSTIDGIYSEALGFGPAGYFLQTGGALGTAIRAIGSNPIYTNINYGGSEVNSHNIMNNSNTTGGYSIIHYIGGSMIPYAISKGGTMAVAADLISNRGGGFYVTSGAIAHAWTEGSRRMVMSGDNLSFQVASSTPLVRVEKYSIAP